MAKRVAAAALACFVLAGCSSERRSVEVAEAPGPPRFQLAGALGHADQFDGEELRQRPAGSEQEQAAAVYLLGVLQTNGYVARLDAVPVRDLYRSTNVIAQPPDGADPEIMVVASYDTGPGDASSGATLGTFLELSRAMNAADRDHSVSFGALGADATDAEGGSLGSRRLAQWLLDEDRSPRIIVLAGIERAGPLIADGVDAEELSAVSDQALEDAAIDVGVSDVFHDAGFDRTVVTGGAGAVGEALLSFLTAARR